MVVENKVLCSKYKVILYELNSLVRQSCKCFVKVGVTGYVELNLVCMFVISVWTS